MRVCVLHVYALVCPDSCNISSYLVIISKGRWRNTHVGDDDNGITAEREKFKSSVYIFQVDEFSMSHTFIFKDNFVNFKIARVES